MARKTTPEKPPTKQEASVAGKALRTGKATPAQIRSMAGRIEFRARRSQTSQEALTELACFRKQHLGDFIPGPLVHRAACRLLRFSKRRQIRYRVQGCGV